MDWQLAAVGLIVAVAGAYLLRRSWRTWFGRKAGGCGSGCHCNTNGAAARGPAGQETLIPVEQLTLRRRGSGQL